MDNKDVIKWKLSLHKDRLTNGEQFLLTMYLYADWNIGKIAKFSRVEAPVVLDRMKKAVNKLWK